MLYEEVTLSHAKEKEEKQLVTLLCLYLESSYIFKAALCASEINWSFLSSSSRHQDLCIITGAITTHVSRLMGR